MKVSLLSLKILLAINVTIMGLGASIVATVHGADKPPAQSTLRCLSPIAEPQLTYRPDGWLIDLDLLVTGGRVSSIV